MDILRKPVLLLIFSLLFYGSGFSQGEKNSAKEEKAPLSQEDVKQAFENAIKTIDSERQNNQKKLTAELKAKLNSAINEWFNTENRSVEAGLNKIIDQKWELLPEFGPRIHYDYILRDYDYLETKTDIIATESLVTPYKATLNTVREIFVERTHSPNAVNTDKFIFTVSLPIKANFEYLQGNFIATSSEYTGHPVLKQGWPEEIKKKFKIFR